MRRTLRGLALAACVLALPRAVAAQGAEEQDIDPIARQRFQIAAQLYARGQFAEAAAEFQRVYEATQHPDVLHNIYVAHRDAGNKREAATALRAYIESGAEIPDRAVMEARLATLEREIAEEDARNAEPEPTPEPDPELAPTVVAPAAEPTRPSTAPREDGPSLVLPLAVVGGGALLLGASGVLGLMVMSEHADLEESEDCFDRLCIGGREDDIDALSTKKTIGDVLLVAGGVTAIVGLTLLIVELAGGSAEESPSVSAGCGGDGCLAAVESRF